MSNITEDFVKARDSDDSDDSDDELLQGVINLQEIIRPPLQPSNGLNPKPQEIKQPPLKPDNIESSNTSITTDANKNTSSTHDENLRDVFESGLVRTTSIGGQKRQRWTDLELYYLERGMEEFGTRWEDILKKYGKPHGPLRNRTAFL
ncbi:5408_t:CDS:2 [Racocetra fulgida]|uniref:5408_t:CDS:1 n=1 Tax=Racocetra fulgida TaxID=60492 RepID=A0A9N9AKZ5_9GLOM|nr:5408_t:CDS:2 [Racocetra fulgida]